MLAIALAAAVLTITAPPTAPPGGFTESYVDADCTNIETTIEAQIPGDTPLLATFVVRFTSGEDEAGIVAGTPVVLQPSITNTVVIPTPEGIVFDSCAVEFAGIQRLETPEDLDEALEVTAALAAATTTLPSTATTSVAPPSDDTQPSDAEQSFNGWAIRSGVTVERIACVVEAEELALCYGLVDGVPMAYESMPNATTDSWIDFVPLGEASSAIVITSSTTAAATATTAPAATTTTAAAGPATSFGPGTQIVGTDIQPGTYSTTVPADSSNCYWERVSGFSGDLDDILANDNSDAGEQVIVEIAPTDVGFSSSGCGTWTLVQ